jgi:hypothetical protein
MAILTAASFSPYLEVFLSLPLDLKKDPAVSPF